MEMVRHLMSLAAPPQHAGDGDRARRYDTLEKAITKHPLNGAIAILFRDPSLLVDGFLQMSLREQIRFLAILHNDHANAFTAELLTLPPADVLQLCDAIRNQSAEEVPANVKELLDRWISEATRLLS
jgi:hypothetical protein